MRPLAWNVGLALVWCALAGSFTIVNALIGFAAGYALIGWLTPTDEARAYLRRLPLMIAFVGYYAWQVIASSLRIAWEIVTPTAHRRPGIIEVPLDVRTDLQIALLANLITFTPGTVTLDLSADRKTIIVHDMFLDDADSARRRIKDGLERWVLRILP
jgi:multicomponent Na+:H+ antiporter subunit E